MVLILPMLAEAPEGAANAEELLKAYCAALNKVRLSMDSLHDLTCLGTPKPTLYEAVLGLVITG